MDCERCCRPFGWEKIDPDEIRRVWTTKNLPWWKSQKNFDEFNQANVDYYKSYSPTDLIREWEQWQSKVQKVIDEIGESNLKSEPKLFKWLFEGPGGFKDSNHYHHHFQQIRQVIEKK